MKLKLFLSLLFIGLFATVNSSVEGLKEICLIGELDPTDARAYVPPSITAEQSDNAVLVNFTKALGTVNVIVTSETGEIVYSTAVNVAGASQFSIYTGDFAAGIYLLEFTKTGSKGQVRGEFIVE